MDSWIWKQILKLKTEAIRFIKPILGNDQTTSFWYDVWTPFCQLITYLGERGPSQLRVPLHGSVSDACSTTSWSIASPRSDEALELQIYLTCVPCPAFSTDLDQYVWITSTGEGSGFNATKTWEDLRPSAPKQTTATLIWFKGAIPRNNFKMWVAN